MFYSKYLIHCCFLENGSLGNFTGPAIRGAFGHALKRAVCTVHEKHCDSCILYHACLFAKFYMEQKSFGESNVASSVPHPFIIEPPINSKRFYNKGEYFDFSIILLGDVYEKLAFIVYAFELMGNKGIGRVSSDENKNISFEITGIHAVHGKEKIQIYDTVKKQLINIPPPIELTCSNIDVCFAQKNENIQELTVFLETPLRYKQDNLFHTTLDFEGLFKLMVRRISVVFKEFSGQDFVIDYQKLLEQAQKITLVKSNIEWRDQNRFSARQKQALKIGGVIGTVTFLGDFSDFIPLLDLATLLHLGKQTSFGLGKIQYELKDIV